MSGCRRGVGRAGARAVVSVALAVVAVLPSWVAAQRIAAGGIGVMPPVAVEAARAAAADTITGQRLQVILLTAGPGDAVWEMFGHNLLWIRDTVSGEGLAWNWGKFSFNEPKFLQRFLLGDTRYWMEGDDVASTLAYYQSTNREVIAQELALTPGERAALLAFVTTHAREENKYYRYDYFLDNCSTRLRDAIDLVTGGALRDAIGGVPTNARLTYRGETLRLVRDDPWLVAGIDLALGRPADAARSPWETAFVPMQLRNSLRDVEIRDGAGGTRRLVVRETVMVPADRAAEWEGFPALPADQWPTWPVNVALSIAVLLGVLTVLRARGATWAAIPVGIVASGAHLAMGLVAAAILAMWLFTKHTFWAWNAHLLLMTPLSLVLAVLIPWQLWKRAVGRGVLAYHVIIVSVAAVIWAADLLLRGGTKDAEPRALIALWAQVSLLLHLALAFALAPRNATERSPS